MAAFRTWLPSTPSFARRESDHLPYRSHSDTICGLTGASFFSTGLFPDASGVQAIGELVRGQVGAINIVKPVKVFLFQ
jgi:hypothetical protein